jgi:hypothetical protein
MSQSSVAIGVLQMLPPIPIMTWLTLFIYAFIASGDAQRALSCFEVDVRAGVDLAQVWICNEDPLERMYGSSHGFCDLTLSQCLESDCRPCRDTPHRNRTQSGHLVLELPFGPPVEPLRSAVCLFHNDSVPVESTEGDSFRDLSSPVHFIIPSHSPMVLLV